MLTKNNLKKAPTKEIDIAEKRMLEVLKVEYRQKS
jgi:hypothetical protein